MPTFPPFKFLNDTTQALRDQHSAESLERFRQDVNTQPVVRIIVDSTPGYGHQASSMFVLRRLVGAVNGPWRGFGYAGTVEVYYQEMDPQDPVLPKLHALLPELQGAANGIIGNATVRLKDLDTAAPAAWVRWGFSGGYDTPNTTPGTSIKARFFVLTQPYRWAVKLPPDPYKPGNLLMWDLPPSSGVRPAKAFVNYDKQFPNGPDWRGFQVAERAYMLQVQELTNADWNYYQGAGFPAGVQRIAAALQYLTRADTLNQVSLKPLAGVNFPSTSVYEDPVPERIVLEMVAVRTLLEVSEKVIKPPIILNFGNYQPGARQDATFKYLQGLLAGGPTTYETNLGLLASTPLGTPLSRQLWLAAVQARARRQASFQLPGSDTQYLLVDFLTDNVPVQELVKWVTSAPKRVLFVQLGFVPPPIFNHVMLKAGLPPMFEGANTTVVALNTGKPYLNTARPGEANIRYPTGYLGQENASEPVRSLQGIANQIQAQLDTWPARREQAPTLVMAAFMAQVQFPENKYNQYFQSLQAYYQQPQNEKLNIALGLAAELASQVVTQGVLLEEAGAEAVGGGRVQGDSVLMELAEAVPSTLQELYQTLQDLIDQGGQVDLLADVFDSGAIHDTYAALLEQTGGQLLITGAKATADGTPVSSVTLTGQTQAFGVKTGVTFTFTELFGQIDSAARFTASLPWNLDGVPWIVFDRPFLQVLASESGTSPSTFVGGRVKGSDFELGMALPVQDGRVVVRGEFDTLKTVSDFFALAGGVDLAAALPAPLMALGGIGVRYTELAYDTSASALDYVAVRLETASPWNLFDRLQLEDLSATVTVLQPANLQGRQTKASFRGMVRIGTKPESPRIEVGAEVPGLVLRGQLADPSLPLDDVLQVFWPGVTPAWPGGNVPTFTQLSLSYQTDTRAYNVGARLVLDWPITIAGTTVLTVSDLSLTLDGSPGAGQGSLGGSVVVLPDSAKLGLYLGAAWLGGNAGWRFEARQTSGVLSISDLLKEYLGWNTTLDISVDGLGLSVETATSSFEFTAKTAAPWVIPIDTGIQIFGDMKVGYNGGTPTLGPDLVRTGVATVPMRAPNGQRLLALAGVEARKPGWFGELNANIKWRGIDLTVFYNFDPEVSSYGVTWGVLTGKIEDKLVDGKVHKVATLRFTEGTTLGSMVETMVSWATGTQFGLGAPWNLLNDITLNNLALTYDFTAGKVGFELDIGPIELGFARITAITVTYRSDAPDPADNGVIVSLKGSFFWQSDPSAPLEWDATKPETTPAPPGNGNKYFDLRLLAMGQHVTLDCFRDADSVQKAIACMANLPEPTPGEIPPVRFDPQSGWLIGADFGVLKVETGPEEAEAPPKYLLTVQTVFNDPHLYALRLALDGPAAKVFKGLDFQVMYRQVSDTVGVYQSEITLPDVMRHLSVGAYSLTLPVFGIAVYTNGDFLVDIGFPWNEDFSRSFTIEAIIYPGIPVLGSAGLYFGKLSSATTNKVPQATNGTFNPVIVFGLGLQVGFGKSIEYGILKAGFSVTAVGILEGVIAKWNPYALADSGSQPGSQLQGDYYFWMRGTVGLIGKVYGSVDFSIVKADVNVVVKLLMQLTYESFVSLAITVIASVDVSVSVKINLGLFKVSIDFSFSMRLKETFAIDNSGTAPWQVASGAQARGRLRAPVERRLRDLRADAPGLLALAQSAPPAWTNLVAAPAPAPLTGYVAPGLTVARDEWKTAATPADQVPCYVALLLIDSVPAAGRDGDASARKAAGDAPDTSFETLSKMVLRWVVAALQPAPLTAAQVDALLLHEADLERLTNEVLVSTSDTPTPIPLDAIQQFLTRQFKLTLRLPPDAALSADVTCFPAPPDLKLVLPAYGQSYPGASYTFGGYNALDTATLRQLRAWFDDLAVQVQREQGAAPPLSAALAEQSLSMAGWMFSDYFLLLARQMVRALRDSLRDFKYPLQAGQTPDQVVSWVDTQGQLGGAFTLGDLFAANASHPLTAGKTLAVGGDTTYPTASGDTLQSVASRFGVALEVLAEQSANGQVKDLFAAQAPDGTAAPYLDVPHLERFPVGALLAEAQRVGALQNLSGMASRYNLHGLRLPTAGIQPKAMGMWVRQGKNGPELPPQAGLYALTGQQFPLPVLEADKPFNATFDDTSGPAWLDFVDGAGKPTSTLVLSLKPGTRDATRLDKVTAYARSLRLDVPLLGGLGVGDLVHGEPSNYPFTSATAWQATGPALTLPYGAPPAGVQALKLWRLPDAMTSLPDLTTRAVDPRFSVQLARFDEATGDTVKGAVGSYGWASSIGFTVKRIPAVDGSPASATTYEVVGAGGNDIVLLERLLDQVRDDDAFYDLLVLGYPAGAAPGSGVRTDAVDGVTFGLAQVNLSTETRPPDSARALFATQVEAAAKPRLLNTPSGFVRLLWEASITRSGGFFLYYFDGAEKRGLPDAIFNDRGEATLTLIAVYSRPAGEAARDRLTGFMNAVVTGDPLDTSNAVVFAQANPPVTTVTAGAQDTLDALAYAFYSDPADVAEANASVPLRAGATLEVDEGVYQAPPGGITLAAVAARFGTTVAALNQANPKWPGGLPDPLSFPAAIRLPLLSLKVGTSAHTATLADVSGFYGQSLTALAAHNRLVQGLFATGQALSIPGGPRVRASLVPPGVQSLNTLRPAPVPVPDDPNAPDFARTFLLNAFSLLSQQVADNVDFKESKPGLPAGPTDPDADAGTDKLRRPRALMDVSTWAFDQAVPYSRFAKTALASAAGLPPASQSPYLGVGKLLQVSFGWQDYYGNRLVTTLSDPAPGDTGPLNQPPVLTGYTDPLVALGQWPSVASSWQVLPGTGGQKPSLELELGFDPSRYQGLLSAAPTDATTLVATFTQPVDAASAADVSRYSVEPGIQVSRAVPSADGRTVTLTVSPLTQGEAYTLGVSDVKVRDGDLRFSGQAGFVPGNPAARSSSVQRNAQQDLRTYTQLYYQLTDPNGLGLSVESSLLPGTGGLPLGQAQVDALKGWLFGIGGGTSIFAFVQDRAGFGTSVAPPAGALSLKLELDPARVTQERIFELWLSFTLTRTGGAVLGELETTPGIRSAATRVALRQDTPGSGSGTLGLVGFARNFEAALSVPGAFKRKVATGVDRFTPSASAAAGAVWAVRVGLTPQEALSYRIQDAGAPALFAPRPVSNTLQSRQHVPLYDYVTGTGISPTPSRFADYTDVDLDGWCQQTFEAIDGVLTPRFTAPLQLVGRFKATDYLQRVLDGKKALARLASLWMVPVFEGESADPAQAREAFFQQLLVRLGAAYTTRAAVEFHASVNAGTGTPQGDAPPRLFGDVTRVPDLTPPAPGGPGDSSSTLTFSSPKLQLQTAAAQPLTFLLSAPDTVRGAGGEVVPAVELSLQYDGARIEHQIGSVAGIEGYQASTWLGFVLPEEDGPLKAGLGRFEVPMVLRAFPASPSMATQSGQATYPLDTAELARLTRWDYAFTYALPFHYPQDRVYGTVEFNLRQTPALLAALEDAFAQLAEFVAVFPAVNEDLVTLLGSIDATTDPVVDKEKVDRAAVAVVSFLRLVEDLVRAAGGDPRQLLSGDGPVGPGLVVDKRPRSLQGSAQLTYSFYVQEGSVDYEDTVGALVVSLVGERPGGMGIPEVLVAPDDYECVRYQPSEGPCAGTDRLCFVYRRKQGAGPDGSYLTAKEGQTIADRQVVLPELDLLERQDAWATVYLDRNRELVEGRPSAEPFVYTTPEVRFSSPLYPTNDALAVVNVAELGSGNPPKPITRTLPEQLQTLFDALLANNTQARLTFQVEVTYAYPLNPGLSDVTLPVLMQAPLTVELKGSGPGLLETMVSDWSAAIELWFSTYVPKGGGTLWLDLTVMSDLTEQPMPLLRLRRLCLPVSAVQPPLATR
ncbi:Ig-like domain-containing protein [Pyxidicoccus xibeiensis]|uniref:Ig-like domain-containing protein n=1 Tax=Pyxidicoccus xibeiensis TaxID=2906759 RepID=UPI0020A828AA|nr:Ig-like domain-containing protein [Pyxidicoccus xibeiensis]MCP3140384.1 Ig-like domain-containing protein [Pyxidicoccus xibeiensis]